MMTEWHVTPDYIVANWTDELLNLMVDKLNERRRREIRATKEVNDSRGTGKTGFEKVSSEELFSQASNLIKVVKKHGN